MYLLFLQTFNLAQCKHYDSNVTTGKKGDTDHIKMV